MIHLDTATILGLLVGYVLPLLSSLVTSAKMPPEVAGLVTALLATVTGFVTEWADTGDGFDWRPAALTALGSFVVAAFARAQTWRGSKTDAKLLAVGDKHPLPYPQD